MKCYISAVCALSVLVALTCAAPMPQSDQDGGTSGGNPTTQIVNGINTKIRLLRQYCPQLFQVIDNVIQNVTSTAFRVIGRVILRSGGLGGGGGGGGASSGGGGGSRVSVVLPTFGPDDDDYDDEEENEVAASSSTSTSTTSTTEASSSSDGASGAGDSSDVDVRITDNRVQPLASSNAVDAADSTEKPLFTSPASGSSRAKREAESGSRVVRAANDVDDQETAASGGNGAPSPGDDLASVDAVDDADRDKRFLPFGGGFGGHAGGGGAASAGGSGNFLFDIIRQTADGAARAAGTVYRLVAGTENTGLGLTATSTSTRTLSQLVAGSGATEESDEKENGPAGAGGIAEIDVAKGGDGYTEGIPGPITRLFVLANRGLANLVQDLILRLAQTSERIVNFKARLVTALI